MVTAIEMPSLSTTMKKGKVVRWLKAEGDPINKNELLFEVETDKANVEVESYVSGFVRKLLVDAGVEVPVNTAIALIADSMDEDVSSYAQPSAERKPQKKAEPSAAGKTAAPAEAAPSGEREIVKISPLAKRIAREKGFDYSNVTGTGPGARIVRADIEKAMAEPPAPKAAPAAAPGVEGPLFEEIELSKMRKVIADRLAGSKRTAPHFYIDMTADATMLTRARNDLVKKSEQLGIKITFNDIIIKLVSRALLDFPMVNASFLDTKIRKHHVVNIGVAVGVDEGLVVPVVKNVDRKSIAQIAKEVRELAAKARNKKLLPSDYADGTFTITNLGMYGVETFHAIINPPESAILAVSSIINKPVAVGDQVVVRPCLTVSLSADHRIVDGVMAAQFLGRVRDLIESPFLMVA